MGSNKKEHVLIGAGKLGRGYLADLFNKAGYHLIFMEYSKNLVEAMREQGYYTLFQEKEDGTGTNVVKIDGYEVYCTEGEEYDICVDKLVNATTASIHTYDDGFKPIGHMLGDAMKKRVAAGIEAPLDIFLVANYLNLDEAFRAYMFERLTTDEERQYVIDKVGLIQTLPYRGGYPASEAMLKQDPIAVSATDYPELPVDEEAFKGPVPEGINFLMLDRMSDRLNCKLWTANVRGGVLAAIAKQAGYETIEEANKDEYAVKCSTFGWKEAYWGAMRHFNFTEEEFKRGARKDSKVYGRTTSDTVDRQLFGLKRKLGRQERLTGPALACLEFDRVPYFLTKGLAMAFQFDNPADPTSVEVLEFVKTEGIEKAIETYCQLDLENPLDQKLYQLVLAQYYDAFPVDPFVLNY